VAQKGVAHAELRQQACRAVPRHVYVIGHAVRCPNWSLRRPPRTQPGRQHLPCSGLPRLGPDRSARRDVAEVFGSSVDDHRAAILVQMFAQSKAMGHQSEARRSIRYHQQGPQIPQVPAVAACQSWRDRSRALNKGDFQRPTGHSKESKHGEGRLSGSHHPRHQTQGASTAPKRRPGSWAGGSCCARQMGGRVSSNSSGIHPGKLMHFRGAQYSRSVRGRIQCPVCSALPLRFIPGCLEGLCPFKAQDRSPSSPDGETSSDTPRPRP
jgi:hypothetical protein